MLMAVQEPVKQWRRVCSLRTATGVASITLDLLNVAPIRSGRASCSHLKVLLLRSSLLQSSSYDPTYVYYLMRYPLYYALHQHGLRVPRRSVKAWITPLRDLTMWCLSQRYCCSQPSRYPVRL